MGGVIPIDKSRKSDDANNYTLQSDMYDTSWIEAIEKSYIFVWCDATVGTGKNVNDDKHTVTELARVVNKNRQLVHTFNELHTCQEFISHVNNVCLIISGSMGQELVPVIHNLEQIHSIYIFCLNKTRHDLWAKNYRKIRGVFTDIGEICQSLKCYIISRSTGDFDRIEFDIISKEIQSPTADQHELSLIYSKLSQTISLNMNSSDHGKQDMINYCRNEYTTEYQIQLINDFERNYSKHNAIWWYTRNCFFQGIINRALRTHDLYALCSMHRFITDMDIKLSQLQEKQETSTEPLNLYFGQFLPQYDLDKLRENRGGLMCINQFVSANSEQGIAVMFIKQQNLSTSNGNKIRVLFQICIDRTKKSNVSYANIGPISEFVHEKEYLLSMSSLYRIDKIDKIPDGSAAWLVQLTLIGQNDSQYYNLTQYIREKQSQGEINLSELGFTIKDRLHQFQSANKLFKQALEKNKQEFRTIILHYNMAIIYDALREYGKALEQYHCVLKIAREFIPTCYLKDDLCLVAVYSNMALTYVSVKNFKYAFEHAFRALGIVKNFQVDCVLGKELESSSCFNLGLILDQEGRFAEAQPFYEQALRLRQEYLPLGHSDVTVLQRLITLLSTKPIEYDRTRM